MIKIRIIIHRKVEQVTVVQRHGMVDRGSSGVETWIEPATNEEPQKILPERPRNLTVGAISSSKIYLEWDKSDNADKYEVLRSSTGNDRGFSRVDYTERCYFIDSGLSPSTRYWYKVYSHNENGKSEEHSTIVDAKTNAASGSNTGEEYPVSGSSIVEEKPINTDDGTNTSTSSSKSVITTTNQGSLSVKINSPKAVSSGINAIAKVGDTINISATASGGSGGINGMRIYINDMPVGDRSSTGSVSYSWNTNGKIPKTYTIKVNAMGNDKNIKSAEIKLDLIVAGTTVEDSKFSHTIIGHTVVYADKFKVSAQYLAANGRLYFTDSNGTLYKKTYSDATAKIDDTKVSLPASSQVKFKPNSVYILDSAKELLYLNTANGDSLFSINPEQLQWCEWKIAEQGAIWGIAANYPNMQKIAHERADALRAAEKGNFTSTYKDYKSLKFIAERQYKDYTINDKVADIQALMSELGYKFVNKEGYSELSDGMYGPIVFTEVARFQMKYGLDVTGQLDQATYDLIVKNVQEKEDQVAKEQAEEEQAAEAEMAKQAELERIANIKGLYAVLEECDELRTNIRLDPEERGYISAAYINQNSERLEYCINLILLNPAFQGQSSLVEKYLGIFTQEYLDKVTYDFRDYFSEMKKDVAQIYSTELKSIVDEENRQDTQRYLELTSLALDCSGLPGLEKSIIQFYAKEDMLTGVPLSDWERYSNLVLSAVVVVGPLMKEMKVAQEAGESRYLLKASAVMQLKNIGTRIANIMSYEKILTYANKAKLVEMLNDAKSSMTLEKLGITEEKFESQLAGGCFVYDTPVLTSNGQKPIGEIKIGDEVWSKDQITGEVSLKPVKNIYVHQVNSILNLWVRGQKLTTTRNHIFYVSGKGWIEAGQIIAKDKVMMKDGSLEEVTKTEDVELTEAVDVYNFEVADWHTYFVGEGILVHNASINPCGEATDKLIKSAADIVLYDVQFAAKQLLRNGRISINDLNAMVRKGAPNEFIPSTRIEEGYKYNYTINGTNLEIKWHSPDAKAATNFPGSNAGNMWTAQIMVDGKLLGQDGKFYTRPSNITHIPVDF